MRRSTLLTQVLAVNALLVGVTAVIAAIVARDRLPDVTSGDGLLVLGLTVSSAVLLNSLLIRARLEPMERLVRAMTGRRPLPPRHARDHAGPRGQGAARAHRRLQPHAHAPRGRAARGRPRRAARAGAGAQPHRPGPPRRGQPGADRDPAAALRDDPGRAVGPALRAAADAGAREPGDGRAARARPPAAPDRARRPRPRRRARLAGLRLRPAHGHAGALPLRTASSRTSPTRSSS